VTIAFLFDVAMACHRHAHDYLSHGLTFKDFVDLTERLCQQYADCPAYALLHNAYPAAHQQIWKTASAAVAAGMTARQAFPYKGDLDNHELKNPETVPT
jgi:hypothetical protein